MTAPDSLEFSNLICCMTLSWETVQGLCYCTWSHGALHHPEQSLLLHNLVSSCFLMPQLFLPILESLLSLVLPTMKSVTTGRFSLSIIFSSTCRPIYCSIVKAILRDVMERKNFTFHFFHHTFM